MWVIVEVFSGGQANQRLEIEGKPVITVGSDSSCDVALDTQAHPLVSSFHGEVRRASDGNYWWVDKGSSVGSFLEGKQIDQVVLRDGNTVELGRGGPALSFHFREAKGVGRDTVARMVKEALDQDRKKRSPRTTRFLRSFVDSEVRKQNRGLFISTLVLSVLLLGAVITSAVFFLRQKKQQQRKDRKHKKELAEALSSGDQGPKIAQKNRGVLYLLAHGTSGYPRYAVCTSFAVSKRVLATNAHCVKIIRSRSKKGSFFYAIKNEDPKFKARVIGTKLHPKYLLKSTSVTPDIGLLKVDKDLAQTVELADDKELKKLKQGSIVFAFGFPGRLADPKKPVATLVHGHVGRLTRFNNALGDFKDNQLIQHSALSMGGASGSPLFNVEGKVIGIHAGSYADKATQTFFASGGRKKKVKVAKKLGYKYGIRVDLIRAFMKTKGWKPVKVTGKMATVGSIPLSLKKVSCMAFKKKLVSCTTPAALASNLQKRCEISKRIPSPTSLTFLRMVQCVLKVKGCQKDALTKCVAPLKKTR